MATAKNNNNKNKKAEYDKFYGKVKQKRLGDKKKWW